MTCKSIDRSHLLLFGRWHFQAEDSEQVICGSMAIADWRTKQNEYPSVNTSSTEKDSSPAPLSSSFMIYGFFFTQRETSNRQPQHWIVSFKLRWFYLRGRCQRSPKDMRPVWPQVRGLFCNEEKTFVLIWNPNKITRQVAYSELHRSFVILNLLYFSWRYKNILKHPFKLAKKNKLPFFSLKMRSAEETKSLWKSQNYTVNTKSSNIRQLKRKT